MWTCDDCGGTKEGMGGGWPPSGWTVMRPGGNLPKQSVRCKLCDLRARAKDGDEWAKLHLPFEEAARARGGAP